MDKELLEKYGEEYQKEYEKTTQYQFDKLREEIDKALDPLKPALHKICKWLCEKLK